MGSVYTNTNNAVSCSTSDGKLGPLGPRGDRGITGNNWVYLPYDPSKGFELFATDEQGNSLPSNTGAIFPSKFDTWLNSITGVWFEWDGIDWIKQPLPKFGPKGPDGIIRTDISFGRNADTRGFTISQVEKDFTVGHVIFPGTSLAGPMTSVKILTQSNTENSNLKVRISLVNINQSNILSDDIVVAQTIATHYLNGNGGDSSWKISDLVIVPANVPTTEEILAVVVRLVEPSSGGDGTSGKKTTLTRYVNVSHLTIT
tara:strand:- start:6435 stop:7208 length:774 start_codon:yes stop_codon:yes gene_type:complete